MKLRMRLAGFEVADEPGPVVVESGGLPFAEDLLADDPLMQAHRRNMARRMNQDAARRRN